MSEVILLSENTSAGYYGISRYIGPYSLATHLESHGIDVAIVDYLSRCESFFENLEKIVNEKTLLVGISTTFMGPLEKIAGLSGTNAERIDNAFDYMTGPVLFASTTDLDRWFQRLRLVLEKKAPHAKIVVGGAKMQFLFESPELYAAVDYVVFGTADDAIVQLVNKIKNRGKIETLDFSGRKILSADDKSSVRCPQTLWKKKWGIQYQEALPIEISRGCIFNCKFCHYDKKESFRKDLETLRNEFIYNYENFGTTYYHFCDDCFNDHPEKVRSVCQLILSLPFKIEWISYARVDVAVKFPDTIDLMIQSGARGLFWGIESLNYDVARRAGKGTPSDKVKVFLQDFYKKYGDQCTSSGSFIVGLPGETRETQLETMNWVIENEALHFIDVMPLKLRPFIKNFDKRLTDFADYSRDPQKYGFKQVTFAPYYWEHETMNSDQAYELTTEFNRKWKLSRSTRRGTIYSIWTYPHLRSLGFTQEEVRQIQTSEEMKSYYYKEVPKRFSERLKKYHTSVFSMDQGAEND